MCAREKTNGAALSRLVALNVANKIFIIDSKRHLYINQVQCSWYFGFLSRNVFGCCANSASTFFPLSNVYRSIQFFSLLLVINNFSFFFLRGFRQRTRISVTLSSDRVQRVSFINLLLEMCERKRVSLINSKNHWHKLFTHFSRMQKHGRCDSGQKQQPSPKSYLLFVAPFLVLPIFFSRLGCPFCRKIWP